MKLVISKGRYFEAHLNNVCFWDLNTLKDSLPDNFILKYGMFETLDE